MSTATATITYRRTSKGEWVAYGPADAITPGATITVTKRDGSARTEHVERAGKAFSVNGVTHRYGYLRKTARHAATGQSCDECGTARATRAAYDSSGIEGRVCGRCGAQPSYMLSFA